MYLELIQSNIELKKEVGQLNKDIADILTALVQKEGGN